MEFLLWGSSSRCGCGRRHGLQRPRLAFAQLKAELVFDVRLCRSSCLTIGYDGISDHADAFPIEVLLAPVYFAQTLQPVAPVIRIGLHQFRAHAADRA